MSHRAVVLHLLNRHEEAMSELNKALDLDPQNPYRYSSRAFLKDRIGDLKGAIADYEKAIEMDPEDAISINNKGLVEEKLGYKERANESFKRADDLVGYQPSGRIANEESAPTTAGSLADADEDNPEEKMTFSSYLSTLGDVITDQNVRKDFFKFVSDKLKRKD